MSSPDMTVPAPMSMPVPILDPLDVSLGREAARPLGGEVQDRQADVLRVGVVGYGYWGPNVVRNLHSLENCEVLSLCDKNPAVLRRAKRQYPTIEMTTDVSDLLTSPQIDAVAIVTPVWTHFPLAKRALENGKHVFLEKPLTSTTEEAEDLIELADKKNLKLMVDHTFLFGGPVAKIRELVDSGMLGRLYYFDSTRVNLGLFQHDVNVIWDLAPHDLSIMDHIIMEKPEAVVATGGRHLNGMADVGFITVYFPGSVIAHVNVNWLSPVKVRTTLIGGEQKMLVWNDLAADEKIRVYDKGVKITNKEDLDHELRVSYRSGDVWAPKVEQTEPLKVELQHFIDCVVNDRRPFNDGAAGLRVVRLLEAADRSLLKRGRIVYL
jgi:predicted dehydrogenase